LYCLRSRLNAKLLTINARLTGLKRCHSCDQRGQRADRREAWHMEARSGSARLVCDPFKELRTVGKRNAAISPAVLMSATEVIASVAQQQRAWCHEFTPGRGTVLKGAAYNNGDRCLRMLFLKRLVHRAGIANNIGYHPPITRGQLQGLRSAPFTCDRNFCQEVQLPVALQP
jgi:hypothetical protein